MQVKSVKVNRDKNGTVTITFDCIGNLFDNNHKEITFTMTKGEFLYFGWKVKRVYIKSISTHKRLKKMFENAPLIRAMTKRNFTEEEDKKIAELYGKGLSFREIADELGRNKGSVRGRAVKMCLID